MSRELSDVPARVQRDRGQFARASPHANMICLAVAGAGLGVLALSLIPLTTRALLWWVIVWALGLGAVLSVMEARKQARIMNGDINAAGAGNLPALGYGDLPRHLMQGSAVHPSLRRLLEVAETHFPGKLVLDPEAVDIADGKMKAWGFRAVETAYLSKSGTQSDIRERFGVSIPGPDGKKGRWRFKFDPNADSFTATQYDGIPPLVYPPHWHVVKTAEEARKNFPTWKCVLGVGEDGQVSISHKEYSHWLIAGKTGGGKTIAAYNIIEQHRAAGWMLLIGDGKGMDYRSYRGIPGVVAYGSGATSSRSMGYIAVIELAYRILIDRQSKDEGDLADNTPVLLVLDEIKAKIIEWSTALDAAEFKSVRGKVELLLSQGRQLRIFTLLLSQDMRDKSIPGSWATNINLTIVVRAPDHITLQKAFHSSVHADVEQIVATMDQGAHGRCIVGGVDPDTGTQIAVEYQGYLGYAPGLKIDDPEYPQPETANKWPSFKAAVSDRVPYLYSRQWFAWKEHPIAEQELGDRSPYIRADVSKFDAFSVEEIEAMQRVSLNRRGPDGSFGRSKKYQMFDPLDEVHYRARKVKGVGDRITDEIS